MKKIAFIILTTSILAACNNSSKNKAETSSEDITQTTSEDFSIIGKKGLLVYPDFKAEVNYLSDSTLHWKTTSPDGKVNEADEKVFYKQLNDHQFFLNWIEADGVSISQVIDTKAQTVTAFGTFADEKSLRGKRSSMNLEGSFEFIK